ncbi:ATP-binding SpoIIE family protein phosphatase [Quadrisphaera sp. DSM 44207]|uniref:ATP-binding SpoIIE family protein phosphatase n=1 Tax=Quadrisphaera sp. DSM 44207 TaxID=1881057 RepID=UPI000884BEE1|nr:ATP-binding SpoIIE family protein phosphatase [Quadrisphaera sp. DSM 44207]SDQ04020.1 Serine phosphatase RsbU, regulator of sigma subunit [Quadrisphaera sp. DSM 44207]
MLTPVQALFAGAGSLRADYEGVDWAAGPLGPVEQWSQSLRTTVSICLASEFPILLWWGPDLVMIYNEAYRPMVLDKHPHALGRPGRDVFPEIWAMLEPMLRAVRSGRETTYSENQLMLLERRGFAEECYFTFSVSGVVDDDGSEGGIFTAALETTAQVIERRRLDLLRRLGALSEALDLQEVSSRALAALRDESADLPAVDLLLPAADGGLVAVEPAGELAAGLIPRQGAIEAPGSVRGAVPAEDRVVRLDVPIRGGDGRPAVLVVRLSDRLAADEEYLSFLGSVASGVGGALSASHQYQIERGRADTQSQLAERLEGLVSVAQLLGGAQTESAVLHVVTGRGATVLGAVGGVLGLRAGDGADAAGGLDGTDAAGGLDGTDAAGGVDGTVGAGVDGTVGAGVDGAVDGTVRLLSSDFLSDDLRAEIAVLPVAFPLPVVHTARTGEPLFLTDRAGTLELFPDAADLYARTSAQASATVPLRSGSVLMGSLSVAWDHPRDFTAADRDLLAALAALCAQALDRVRARAAERESVAAVQRMSETLQRSLLTEPPQADDLQIAVRYSPASEQAQVGGDWYDAFTTPDGCTSLVIGDVTGHDRDAAAAMGQVRNLLRATAYAAPASPAGVLAALEQAMSGLAVDTLATAVLAQLERTRTARGEEQRVLRWSNAGHLPPLLRRPDGTVTVLDSGDPDLLLGLDPATARTDGRAVLEEGATLLLYTDGLVEQRGEALDAGVERLRAALRDLGGLPLEELCDRLLDQLREHGPAGRGGAADDVALLAVRAHPRARAVARTSLPSSPASVSPARRFAVQACRDAGLEDLTDTVALLVSEVATNAVRHGEGDVRITVLAAAASVRIEVADDAAGAPVPRTAREEDEGGRGLALVDALSTAWGAEPAGRGKVVWFEVGA